MDTRDTTVKARTLWQLLALDDTEPEATDLVEMNLSVAREIPSLKHGCCPLLPVPIEIFMRKAPRFRRWNENVFKPFPKKQKVTTQQANK